MIAFGDITERFLRFFGITKERVQSAIGKQDCGCAKRQEAMNRWGYRWQYRIASPCRWLSEKWLHAVYGAGSMRLRLAWLYIGMAVRALIYGR